MAGTDEQIWDVDFCFDSQPIYFENGASGSDLYFSKNALTVLVAGTSFPVNVFFAPSSEPTLDCRFPDDLIRPR